MSYRHKLMDELKAVVLATLFFAAWLSILVVLKGLLLAEYKVPFHGLPVVLFGALVMAKVVLVMEHVPLGGWVRKRPVVLDVFLRTGLYALGVFLVLLLEKAFDARHEHEGFIPSLLKVFHHPDMNHVWVNAIAVGCALLGFNALSVVRRHLGKHGLTRLFLSSPRHLTGDKDTRE